MVLPHPTTGTLPLVPWAFPTTNAGRRPFSHASISPVIPFRRKVPASPVSVLGADISAESMALARAAEGDQRAFAEFYDLISPLVFGVVLKVMRNRALAEEVTQEVFVELWRLAPKFDTGRGSAKAWACTIARRRAIDRVRSEEAARRRDERDAELVAVPADTVSEAAIHNAERVMLAGAFGQLSDKQRAAVELAFFGGHSYRTVAAILDEPEGTVKTRIRDGLNRLRELMEVEP